jgi:GT2 family glycosyltransferase
VIVTWNSERVIEQCIRSLLDQVTGQGIEVVVVDNGSADRTVALARSVDPNVKVVENSSNRGLAAANNQGLCASSRELIVICNPDVVFRAGALDALVSTMQSHPRAGWVVPRLLHEDGSLQTSAGDLPNLTEALLGRQGARVLNRMRGGRPAGFWWDGWAHDEERPIGRGHEAAYLVRRKAVEEVGLQDERYVLDWEGLDWTDRFRKAGWEVWLSPRAEVIHLGGDSIKRVRARSIVSQHRGMYLYFSSRLSPVWKPALAAAFASRAAVKLGLNALGAPMYERALRGRRGELRAS